MKRRFMRQVITAFIAALLLITAAQAAQFTGVVVDKETGNPLPGATITIENTNQAAPAGSGGLFTLSSDEPSLTVTVSHVGYKSLRGISLSSDSEVRIELARSISVLYGIVVTATRYEKEAFKTSQPITSSSAAKIETKGYP